MQVFKERLDEHLSGVAETGPLHSGWANHEPQGHFYTRSTSWFVGNFGVPSCLTFDGSENTAWDNQFMKMLRLDEPKELNQIQCVEPVTGTENWSDCDRHMRKKLNQQTLVWKQRLFDLARLQLQHKIWESKWWGSSDYLKNNSNDSYLSSTHHVPSPPYSLQRIHRNTRAILEKLNKAAESLFSSVQNKIHLVPFSKITANSNFEFLSAWTF